MSFDRVARVYRFVESLAFGRTLQRARVAWLDEVTHSKHALIVGEGDGRFLEQLLRAAPEVHVDCVDGSAGMIATASARVDGDPRVRFIQADLATFVPALRYDLVVTHFVLDCFDGDVLSMIVARLAAALEEDGTWLLADFTVPHTSLRAIRARFWLRIMYAFFAVVTGLRTRRLVDPSPLLEASGLQRARFVASDAGFIASSLWRAAR